MQLTFRPTEIRINGKDFIGAVEEVTVSLNRKFKEQDALGIPFPADVPIPGKFEKPEAKIKFKNAPPIEILKKALSPDFFVRCSFVSKLYGINEATGLVYEEDFTVRVNGWLKGAGEIPYKEDTYEEEISIAVVFIELKGTETGKITAVGINGLLQDELNLLSQGVTF